MDASTAAPAPAQVSPTAYAITNTPKKSEEEKMNEKYWTQFLLYGSSIGVMVCGLLLVSEYIEELVHWLGRDALQALGYAVLIFVIGLCKRFKQPVAATAFVVGLCGLVSYTLTVHLAYPKPQVFYFDALASLVIMAYATILFNHKVYGILTSVVFFGLGGLESEFSVVLRSVGLTPIALAWLGLVLGLPATFWYQKIWKIGKSKIVNNFAEPFLCLSYFNYMSASLYLTSEWWFPGHSIHWWWIVAFLLGHLPVSRFPDTTKEENKGNIWIPIIAIYIGLLWLNGLVALLDADLVVRYWVGFTISIGILIAVTRRVMK